MTDLSIIASEVFTILQSYDYTVMLYDEDGNRVEEPSDARRMFARPENLMVSLIEEEDNSAVRMYIGKGTDINKILGLVQALRNTATKFNCLFNIRTYAKEIEPKDFSTHQAVTEQAEQWADKIINEARSIQTK